MLPRLQLTAALFLALAPSAFAGDPGHVYFERLASPDLDRFTNSPNASMRHWFQQHWDRMIVFSTYFDNKTSWFPNSLVYINLYGIPKESPLCDEHPDWILKDRTGQRLFIPWGCGGGTCPQYAGDVANPGFRQWWIARARGILSHGYRGIWIDDVNLEFRVGDGNSNPIPPLDTSTGQVMTWDAWRQHVAQFVTEIRQAFPRAEIGHNSIWFAGPPGIRDRDPAIQKQIAAADHINIEHGIGSDKGLQGGTGEWSVHALFDYIDRVHAAGKGVTLEEFTTERANQLYALAGYFLISSGNDRISDTSNPSDWWTGYETDLGSPLGARTYDHGVFRREFAKGLVLLGQPGLGQRTIHLPRVYRPLDSAAQTDTVTLAGRQGLILLNTKPQGTR